MDRKPTRPQHSVCSMLRELRHARGLSLDDIQREYGWPSVVVGSYERGDRIPPIHKLDELLRTVYGYQLTAVPLTEQAVRVPSDIAATLRLIADQLETRHDV